MTHYQPVNIFSADPGPVPPSFIGQRERVTCPHCNLPIVIAVRPELIDWERVAASYRSYAVKLSRHYTKIAKETEEMFGENPASAYFRSRILDIIERLKGEMNKFE